MRFWELLARFARWRSVRLAQRSHDWRLFAQEVTGVDDAEVHAADAFYDEERPL